MTARKFMVALAGDLPPERNVWLEDVASIVTRTERDIFLKLRKPAGPNSFWSI